MNFTPVIIIGAGRSGTNMLRDIITSIDGFETWGCDEINPVWRYGNKDFPTDELPLEKLNPSIKTYIRGRFTSLHNKTNAKYIVEKTCANSLRLKYVFNVFPEAKYILINRDGRDVVPSAMKRWGAKFELKYTLKKLRYVPLRDLFYYVAKFGLNRLKKNGSKEKNLSFWGPLYTGYTKDVSKNSLLEICANQWKHCAENTIRDRNVIPSENIFDIRYEVFVKNPVEEMKRFATFMNIDLSEVEIKKLVLKVSEKSIGSHKNKFNSEELKKLNEILYTTLLKLDYINE